MYQFEVKIGLPTEPVEVKALIDWVEKHQTYGGILAIGVNRAFNRLLAWQDRGLLANCEGQSFSFWFNDVSLAIKFAALHGAEARVAH